MNNITLDDLKTLLNKHTPPCVSIYMSTHRSGDEKQQDPIRLKNLLDDAEQQLLSTGMRAPDAENLLAPAAGLHSAGSFWQFQSDGLAIFRSVDFFQYYQLPLQFTERAVTGQRFYIRPLLRYFSNDGKFYVLALSQDEVRLLEGTRYTVRQVPVEKIPANLKETMRFDVTDVGMQWRFPRSANYGQGQAGSFHGQGETKENIKTELLQYFRQINEGVSELLMNDHAPLVLAGVEYLFPIYREANTYRYLVEEGIPGSPDGLSASKLHDAALNLIGHTFDQGQKEALDRLQLYLSKGKGSEKIEEIVPAAVYGRVDTLFVPRGKTQWGAFNAETGQVTLATEATLSNQELLDLAAAHAFLNNGTVYVLDPGQMPDGAIAAATFRY